MKYLLFAFLLFPFASFCQKTDTLVFNGAKKIIVKTTMTAADGLKLASSALSDHGFIIEAANMDLGTLRTEQKKVGTFGVQIIDIRTKDNEIIISSRARTTIMEGIGATKGDIKDFQVVPYRDKKLIKAIFNEMDQIARSLKSPFVYSD